MKTDVKKFLKNGYKQKNGKFFFDLEPSNVIPSKKVSSLSKSRKYDKEFYLKNLKGKGGLLLDIGAGNGKFADILEKYSKIGVDFEPYEQADVIVDITKTIPLKDNVGDIVLLSNVLEHIPTPGIVLQESHRVLKNGGFLIGTVPFMAHVHMRPHDFLRYTDIMLEKLMREAGFSNVTVVPLEYPFDLYEWAQERFFNALLYKAELSGVKRWKARIAVRIIRETTKSSKNIFYELPMNSDFTRRYGFMAYKK